MLAACKMKNRARIADRRTTERRKEEEEEEEAATADADEAEEDTDSWRKNGDALSKSDLTLLEKVVAAPMLLDTYTLARDWAIFDFSDFSFRLLLFWHQIIKPSGFLDL